MLLFAFRRSAELIEFSENGRLIDCRDHRVHEVSTGSGSDRVPNDFAHTVFPYLGVMMRAHPASISCNPVVTALGTNLNATGAYRAPGQDSTSIHNCER